MMMNSQTHDPVACVRDVQGTQYVTKGYKSKFTCPTCERSAWQHLSFLGQKSLFCNGRKFVKARHDWHLDLTHEMFMELFT
jgi:hypothetical protein